MPRSDLVPDKATIRGWIETVFDRGVRRPGYPADRWAEQWLRERFEELGLERVRLEPVETPYWEPQAAELVVGHDAVAIGCSPAPFCQPATVEGELVHLDPLEPGTAAGRVALVDLQFPSLPATFPVLGRRAEPVDAGTAAPAQDAGWVFDPGGSLERDTHVPPFSLALMHTMEPAVAAGATGFVGVLRDYPGGGRDYYVPYDGESRPIPGVYLTEADGDRLAALLAAAGGRVPVRLRVDATREHVTTYNIVGELPGADDQWVVIGSHHDGPWASAVEDGSGISLVLAQAAYWSRVPAAERPHRLVFSLMSAHMAGGRGTEAFCDRHRADLDRIVLEVHLEHAARECVEESEGGLRILDRPVPRWWFTSENPDLERAVWDALEAEGLERSLLMTPTALGERPTTDGGRFHLEGVPIVNYLTAPWYLFDACDTMDKIHDASLEPVSRAAVRLVEWTAGRTAAEVRAGVRRAPEAGTESTEDLIRRVTGYGPGD